MITFLIFTIFWICLLLAILYVPGTKPRRVLSILPSLIVLVGAFTCFGYLSPAEKLLLAFPALLFSIKAGVLLHQYDSTKIGAFSRIGLLLYMTVWPGINPRPFEQRQSAGELDRHRFARGYIMMWLGLVCFTVLAIVWTAIPAPLSSVLGLASMLLAVHLGYTDVISSLLQWLGWNVAPLFDEPWKSISIREFWGRRWNIAFVEMNKEVFLPFFRKFSGIRTAVFLAFVISGLLHELAIDYPAGSTSGGPLVYFLLQGVLCMIEARLLKKNRIAKELNGFRRACVWASVLFPLPLLFTAPFLQSIVTPLFETSHAVVQSVSLNWILDKLIWFAAAGNFLTMVAGVQVPARLNWKEELAKLTIFNRKVIMNYYFYVGGIIACWGLLTIILHDDFLQGNRIAGILATIMTIFWGARVLVDILYFKHKDWPQGTDVVIGHALLTTLFVFLTAAYASLAVWCTMVRS